MWNLKTSQFIVKDNILNEKSKSHNIWGGRSTIVDIYESLGEGWYFKRLGYH